MNICDMFNDNRICRLCMGTDQLISIFDYNENDNVSLSYKIQACTSVQIFPTDILPKNICQKCLNQINQSYVFLQRSQYINNFLQCRYEQNTNSVPIINSYNHIKIESIENISFEEYDKLSNLPIGSYHFPKSPASSFIPDDHHSDTVNSDLRNLRSQLSCTLCSTVFNRTEYQKHFEAHRHRQLITSDLQSSQNRIKSTLRKKKTSSELNYLSMFRCHICKKLFMTWTELRRHFFKGHNRKFGKMKCKCLICKSLYLIKNLKAHYRNAHNRSFCELCNFVFLNDYCLEVHIELKHRLRGYPALKTKPKKLKKLVSKPYFCCVCKKSFSTHINMFRHIQRHAQFPCTHCKKSFSSKMILLRHKHLKHS